MSRDDVDTRNSGPELRYSVWIALIVLMVGALLHRLAHADRFVVPATDFYAYRGLGSHLLQLELPDKTVHFLPGLPVLLALVDSVIPGSNHFMHAGQAISLAASLALFPLLFLVGRRVVGAFGALILVWLFCFNPEVTTYALQPITDSLFLALTVGAAYALRSGSPWAYALAGAAALVRYEGILLIVGVFVSDALAVSRTLRRVPFALAAVAPLYAWLALIRVHNQAVSLGQAQSAALPPVGVTFLKTFAAASLEYMPRSFGAAVKDGDPIALAVAGTAFCALVLLACAGFRGVARREQSLGIFFLAFGLPFVALHMRIGWATERYVLPILWIFHLLVIAGAGEVGALVRTRSAAPLPSWMPVAGVGAACALLLSLWAMYPPASTSWAAGILLSAPLVVYACWVGCVAGRRRAGPGQMWWVALSMMVVFGGVGGYDYASYCIDRNARRYAELLPFSRWYKSRAGRQYHVVCSDDAYEILTAAFDLSPTRLVNVDALRSSAPEQLRAVVRNCLVLWNESSLEVRGLDKHRQRKERAERSKAELIRAVHDGAPGWRALRRFEHRGRRAVLYIPTAL